MINTLNHYERYKTKPNSFANNKYSRSSENIFISKLKKSYTNNSFYIAQKKILIQR